MKFICIEWILLPIIFNYRFPVLNYLLPIYFIYRYFSIVNTTREDFEFMIINEDSINVKQPQSVKCIEEKGIILAGKKVNVRYSWWINLWICIIFHISCGGNYSRRTQRPLSLHSRVHVSGWLEKCFTEFIIGSVLSHLIEYEHNITVEDAFTVAYLVPSNLPKCWRIRLLCVA